MKRQDCWYIKMSCGHKMRFTKEDALRAGKTCNWSIIGMLGQHVVRVHELKKIGWEDLPKAYFNYMTDGEFKNWKTGS